MIDDKKMSLIVDLTFKRLNIPLDPNKADINQALKVIALKNLLEEIMLMQNVLGLGETLEIIRALCDCIDLGVKEMIKR